MAVCPHSLQSLSLWIIESSGGKIERDQWSSTRDDNWRTYRNIMTWSWEETATYAPEYFKRLGFSVSKAAGRVLEVGCGIGSMTRWLSQSTEVDDIVAIDTSPEAIDELKKRGLPRVTPLRMNLEDIQLDIRRPFDSVLICEVLEHLYPNEELRFLDSIRSHVDSKTRFVVSVPIGWMNDPYHVRGFSKAAFRRHLRRLYGNPIEIDVFIWIFPSCVGMF